MALYQDESYYLPPGAMAEDAAGESFHVLNVVEGTGVLVEPTDPPAHLVVYALLVNRHLPLGVTSCAPLGAGRCWS